MKLLLADALSDKALEILASANLTADVKTGLKAEEAAKHLSESTTQLS